MTFRFVANCLFDAQDIDDAFLQLARHFRALAESSEDEALLEFVGDMELKPEKN